jgi:hypothetical protein
MNPYLDPKFDLSEIASYIENEKFKYFQIIELIHNIKSLTFMIQLIDNRKKNDFSGYIGSDEWKKDNDLLDSIKIRVITLTANL